MNSNDIHINLNDYWRVKLTDEGLKAHRLFYHDLFGGIPGYFDRYPYEPPVIDQDGYWKEQGWRVMQIMGPKMNMCSPAILPEILIENKNG